SKMRNFKIIGFFATLIAIMNLLSSCREYKVPNQKVIIDNTASKDSLIITARDTTEEEVCRTEKIKMLSGSPETMLLDPQSDVIYPGSVIDASSLQNGKFTPIVGQRKPIKISISIPNLDTIKKEVSNP